MRLMPTSCRPIEITRVSPTTLTPVVDCRFPSALSTWRVSKVELLDIGTHFGCVVDGKATLTCSTGRFKLRSGMYFSVPGPMQIEGLGCGFIATRLDFGGFFQLGGPAEQRGRLRYIDGCSDSLLISPVVLGDPCLNLLYLPPRTTQRQHTHPSCRLGMIASGRGVCRTPDGDFDLHAGMVFQIAPDAKHSFHTQSDSLRVFAWHPDSDTGPTHHDHPMINRTMIDGVSASTAIEEAPTRRDYR